MATQQDIDEIKAAIQARRAGRAVASISSSGSSVSYAQMTLSEMQAALVQAESEFAGRPKRGAIGIRFRG